MAVRADLCGARAIKGHKLHITFIFSSRSPFYLVLFEALLLVYLHIFFIFQIWSRHNLNVPICTFTNSFVPAYHPIKCSNPLINFFDPQTILTSLSGKLICPSTFSAFRYLVKLVSLDIGKGSLTGCHVSQLS